MKARCDKVRGKFLKVLSYISELEESPQYGSDGGGPNDVRGGTKKEEFPAGMENMSTGNSFPRSALFL
jgi:hypothetical protein